MPLADVLDICNILISCYRYARELCSYSTADDNDILTCETALVNSLRNLENKMQYEDDTTLYKTIINQTSPEDQMNNSSRLIVKITTDLFGILSSMGQMRRSGMLWTDELCMYEGLTKYKSCKISLLKSLRSASSEADHLGSKRKKRTTCSTRSRVRGRLIDKRTPNDVNSMASKYVGPYPSLKRSKKANNIPASWEANHIPAFSAFLEEKTKINSKSSSTNVNSKKKLITPFTDKDIIAHYIPKGVHQTAMVKVGTSKNSKVARSLRKYEQDLIANGRLNQAVKLDIVASYGRANSKFGELDVNALKRGQLPTDFEPAVFTNRRDLHAVVNEYAKKRKISAGEAGRLHSFIEKIANKYRQVGDSRPQWFGYIETEYGKIIKDNADILGQSELRPIDRVPEDRWIYG